jgi:hypothetical protein
MNFQKIVLTVATVILIVLLVVIGVTLAKASSDSESWPPIVGECPDYWVDLSGNGEQCLNSHSLGRCNLPTSEGKNTMNFNRAPFTGENGTCSKYKWANTCKVTWDGITSGVLNPCDTSNTTTTTTS